MACTQTSRTSRHQVGPTPPLLTFRRFHAATADLSSERRCELFRWLTDEERADCWQKLRDRLESDRILDGVLTLRERRRLLNQPIQKSASPAPRTQTSSGDDVLDTIAPTEYVEALTGEQVPSRGGSIRCPLPGHDDRTPSCHVYADPGRGWYCHGCHRGGSAIDLAAELTGIEPRGEGYRELRLYIAERLLGVPA